MPLRPNLPAKPHARLYESGGACSRRASVDQRLLRNASCYGDASALGVADIRILVVLAELEHTIRSVVHLFA